MFSRFISYYDGLEQIRRIEKISSQLFAFIDKFSLENVDTTQLSNIFKPLAQQITEIIGISNQYIDDDNPYDLIDKLTVPCFQCAKTLLLSKKVEKQIVGAEILSTFASSSYYRFRNRLKELSGLKELVQTLLSQDLHIQLLKALEPLLSVTLTQTQVLEFWRKSSSAHSSQKAAILQIVAKAFQSFDTETAHEFIQTVNDITFLQKAAQETYHSNPKIFVDILIRLMNLPDATSELFDTFLRKSMLSSASFKILLKESTKNIGQSPLFLSITLSIIECLSKSNGVDLDEYLDLLFFKTRL